MRVSGACCRFDRRRSRSRSQRRQPGCGLGAPPERDASHPDKTFKAEEGEDFEGASDVRAQVFDFIEVFFNQTRLHSTLGYLSTAHYEKVAVSIPQAASENRPPKWVKSTAMSDR